VNSYTVSLPALNTVLRFPGSQVLKFVIFTKNSQYLPTLLLLFPIAYYSPTVSMMTSRSKLLSCPKIWIEPYLRWDSTFTVGIPTVKVESHLKP